MTRPGLLLALLALCLTGGAAQARPVQVCAWMEESWNAEDEMKSFRIQLEADGDLSFYYQMAGGGIVEDDGDRGRAPNSGTYVLRDGEPASPWSYGTTFTPPGRVDVVIEIRETPKDIFSDEVTPLLTSFTFQRAIPEGETEPPPDLARRQCATVQPPPK